MHYQALMKVRNVRYVCPVQQYCGYQVQTPGSFLHLVFKSFTRGTDNLDADSSYYCAIEVNLISKTV